MKITQHASVMQKTSPNDKQEPVLLPVPSAVKNRTNISTKAQAKYNYCHISVFILVVMGLNGFCHHQVTGQAAQIITFCF